MMQKNSPKKKNLKLPTSRPPSCGRLSFARDISRISHHDKKHTQPRITNGLEVHPKWMALEKDSPIFNMTIFGYLPKNPNDTPLDLDWNFGLVFEGVFVPSKMESSPWGSRFVQVLGCNQTPQRLESLILECTKTTKTRAIFRAHYIHFRKKRD